MKRIYKTCGTHLSELSLQQKPKDIETVPDNKIAVTMTKTVLIIDVKNLKDIKIEIEITLQKTLPWRSFIVSNTFCQLSEQ